MPRRLPWFVVVALAAGACIGERGPQVDPAPVIVFTDDAAPQDAPDEVPDVEVVEPHPVSVQALVQRDFDGRNLRIRRTLGRNDAYTRHVVTYRSDGLLITGLMVVPHGDGPFPVLVLAHGYIDPDVYSTGRGFERSQDHLARNGYVVLHTDYRNHAGSDADPDNDFRLRLGYAEDVINAALAVRASDLPYLDGSRIGLLGRSMGGSVALNAIVAMPDLFGAAALHAPTSSDAVDNFERWIRRPARRALAERIIDAYGAPEENPTFWRNASPRTFFDRIQVPVEIHHGVDDDTCPIRWSHDTVAALEAAGKDVTLHTYPGEGHAFGGAAQARAMQRTVAFFAAHLR